MGGSGVDHGDSNVSTPATKMKRRGIHSEGHICEEDCTNNLRIVFWLLEIIGSIASKGFNSMVFRINIFS